MRALTPSVGFSTFTGSWFNGIIERGWKPGGEAQRRQDSEDVSLKAIPHL